MLRKRGFILLLLIALIWWLNFYRRRLSGKGIGIVLSPSSSRVDINELKKKDDVLKDEIVRKAEKAFRSEFGREPEGITELVEEGFLSPEISYSD